MLIGELSTKCARRDADKTAIVFDDVRINFSEFNNRVNQCAAFLISKGLSKGDKIAILSRNHPVMLEVLFAAAKCGIVYVPINFRLASVEVNFVIRDSGAKLFLVSDVFNVTIDPDLPVVPLSLEKDYENCIKNKPVSEPCVDVKTQDPFAIFYTSGTTGDPKGVVLSHENFISNIVNEIISYGIRPDDICLHTLPLYHTAEASFALAQFYIGGTCVVQVWCLRCYSHFWMSMRN
jgi:fatty-acyl-CoA synthase